MPKVTDAKIRFSKFVKIVENGCHEWTSVISKRGYGKFYFKGKQEPAHRVCYILFVGEIPNKINVLHKCDNRKCVNPEHLFLGTQKENIKDCINKGRRVTRALLTFSQAEEVRKMLTDRNISQQKIADLFGVHQTVISRIHLGVTTKFKL